jgi:hypothetical protein
MSVALDIMSERLPALWEAEEQVDEFQVNADGELDLDVAVARPAARPQRPRRADDTPLQPPDQNCEAWTEEDFELHGFKPCDPADVNQDDYLLDPDPDVEPPDDWPELDPADDDEDLWLAGLPNEVRAEYLAGPWTGEGEAEAAGFLHHVPGPSGRGFASGGALDTLDPGPWLAKAVTTATADGHGELGESELIGVLCGWQRLISWAQAGQAVALTELTGRRGLQSAELRRPDLAEHLDDEVAAALTLTGRSAGRLLSAAAGLARLAAVRAALSRGEIDWPRACLFWEQLALLPDEVAAGIVTALIGRAGGMTTGQLRAALARAILAADPHAAQRRQDAARTDAEVQVWAEPSGNAALVGRELRPSEVIAASQRLTEQARWLQARGADGSIGQLRAAAFLAMLTGRSLHSLLPAGPGSTGECDAAEPLAASPGGPQLTGTVNLTMPMSAWLGVTDSPGELASYGPVDAATARQLAGAMNGGTQWCLTLTGADGRAAAHACARTGPQQSRIRSAGDRCTAIRWAADLKRRLQLLETAPCGHGRRSGSYTPPRSLRHLIEIRQRTCAFPGCRRTAQRADLDHTVPFHLGGATCECNLAPLCRRHHRAKQAPGWHLDQPEPGQMTWRPPSGRVYETTGGPYC